MNIPVIGFIPPFIGVEGVFNTFRLGLTLTKRLQPGMEVFLMCEKTKTVFGRAEVISLSTGPLTQMCLEHGRHNHSELGKPDPETSPERLLTLVRKIFGPHIATDNKKTTVVYLRRMYGSRTNEHDADRQVQKPDYRRHLQGRRSLPGVDAPSS
ncbi:hypothetical protein LP414_27240 [Polaromonas sp. P1(28)-13]|nr:hypothetical protein LP414_27240 [Polaromonas sp. P1(28)-13]